MKYSSDEKELVIARLRAIPDNAIISIGLGTKTFTKDDMIREIEKNTETGNKIIEMQMFYLKSLKKTIQQK